LNQLKDEDDSPILNEPISEKWNYGKSRKIYNSNKILRRHYLRFYNDKRQPEIPDGTKLIYLKRENRLKRAISLYIACYRRRWRIYNKENGQEVIPYYSSIAMACYSEVASVEHNRWEKFLSDKDHLLLNYSMLGRKALLRHSLEVYFDRKLPNMDQAYRTASKINNITNVKNQDFLLKSLSDDLKKLELPEPRSSSGLDPYIFIIDEFSKKYKE
jgi:hypothetical protein